MPYRSKTLVFACLLGFAVQPAGFAADSAEDGGASDRYRDQDSWERYADKEQNSGFKLTKPHEPPRHDSVLAPILAPKPHQEPGQSYVLMPGSEPQQQMPPQHMETTMVPVVRQNYSMNGYWSGRGYWGAPAYGYNGFRGGYGGYWGPSGPAMMYRPTTRVVQTAPTRPSGNYYNPSTPDPTASGNYFASPSGLPKAAPIIQQQGGPQDYWGGNGNPLPTDMRP